jgi:2-dehydro-3-deoxyphosphogluconate aldolase/(4S)-4-hydroxy-2-oxoglutarate aldolase
LLSIEEAFPNRVAGVIRTDDSQAAFKACLAAVEGGIGTLEVTTGVPDWSDLVRGLIASDNVPVGVGTVVRADMVDAAADAGAAFVVSPFIVPEVAEAARRRDILLVMGALTPTEIYQALHVHKAPMVKVFPVASAGGPAYIKLLSGPMPGIPLWVSGGVELDQVAEYLKLGVKAVGLTTALFPPDKVKAGDKEAIAGLARRAVAALAGVA